MNQEAASSFFHLPAFKTKTGGFPTALGRGCNVSGSLFLRRSGSSESLDLGDSSILMQAPSLPLQLCVAIKMLCWDMTHDLVPSITQTHCFF